MRSQRIACCRLSADCPTHRQALLGVYRARLVFAADFSRELEIQKGAALCMNFEKRKLAVKFIYCFVQITQQLLPSLDQHVQLVLVSKNVCQDAEPNLKLSVQLNDRTTDFFKKADDVRKQCNKSLKNCSTAQPANTVVKQNIAIFCVKCGQVILESSVVQGTGANEIHDFNNRLHRFLPAATSFCTQGLLMINAVIRKQARLFDLLKEPRNDRVQLDRIAVMRCKCSQLSLCLSME